MFKPANMNKIVSTKTDAFYCYDIPVKLLSLRRLRHRNVILDGNASTQRSGTDVLNIYSSLLCHRHVECQH